MIFWSINGVFGVELQGEFPTFYFTRMSFKGSKVKVNMGSSGEGKSTTPDDPC
jgi:hypothetical protein